MRIGKAIPFLAMLAACLAVIIIVGSALLCCAADASERGIDLSFLTTAPCVCAGAPGAAHDLRALGLAPARAPSIGTV